MTLAEIPTVTLNGEGPGNLFGLAVLGVGDEDRDGFDDILVSAPEWGADGTKRGKVYLYRGTAAGIELDPMWTATGPEDGATFGWSTAAAKNIGDGFADIIVAAAGIGRVIVYRGSKNGPANEPTQTIASERIDTLFGYSIATGDVNHDGADDLLIGEPYHPSGAIKQGRALLYLWTGTGFADRPVWSAVGPVGSRFGIDVALGGDVNHDGYADAVIGANTQSFGADLPASGAAYVYLGSAAGLDSVATLLPGRQAGADLGSAVSIGGDFDGDGFSDVIVGAEYAHSGEQEEGVIEVYFGSKSGISPYGAVSLESNTMGANFGAHTAPLGDLDGDGCDELFVGALRFQRTMPREGAAFVFRGSRDRRLIRAWFRARGEAGSWYGGDGTGAGDVNGDGFADFVVAAPSFDTEVGKNVGQVELFLNTRKK
jgi:hypothetical protein